MFMKFHLHRVFAGFQQKMDSDKRTSSLRFSVDCIARDKCALFMEQHSW